MLDPRCRKRVHDWGHVGAGRPGDVCKRPECGARFYGGKGRAAVASAPVPSSSAPKLALVRNDSAPVGGAPRPGLAGAAARLARARGLAVVPSEPPVGDVNAAPSVVPAEGAADSSEDRESLTDWLMPVVPDMVVSGCGWSIKKAGRVPNDPDPLWEKRFRTSYEQSLGHYIPRVEMHPAVALLVATAFLWLSMWWGAPKAKKDEGGKENKASAPAPAVPSAPVAEVVPCPTPAPVPSPVVSLPSVDGSEGSAMTLDLIPPSSQPDASGGDGAVMSVERSA